MKNLLISLLMGIILGGGGVWYFLERDRAPGLQGIDQRAEFECFSTGLIRFHQMIVGRAPIPIQG